MLDRMFLLGEEAAAVVPTISLLSKTTPVTTTSTPVYTTFSTTFTPASSATRTYIAWIQSRDSNGTLVAPFTSVTIGGVTATIVNRQYAGAVGDYNACCVAYVTTSFTGSTTLSVQLGTTHEGEANVIVWAVDAAGVTPTVTSSSNLPSVTAAVSTTLSMASAKQVFIIASGSTSNSNVTPVLSYSVAATSNVNEAAEDMGTTEFSTVDRRYYASSPSSVNVTSTVGSITADHAVFSAAFAW